MSPLMEPYLYEHVTAHQVALREIVQASVGSASDEAPAVRAVCVRMHWCPRDALAAGRWRLLGVFR